MRAIWSIVLVAAILAGVFGPPTPDDPGYTVFPSSLDELYRLIDEEAPGWTFEGECPAGEPLLTWAQVRQITAANTDGDAARLIVSTATLDQIGVRLGVAGTLNISENDLFGLLVWGVLGAAWNYHYQPTCKPDGDRLGVYGPAVGDILGQLAGYVK